MSTWSFPLEANLYRLVIVCLYLYYYCIYNYKEEGGGVCILYSPHTSGVWSPHLIHYIPFLNPRGILVNIFIVLYIPLAASGVCVVIWVVIFMLLLCVVDNVVTVSLDSSLVDVSGWWDVRPVLLSWPTLLAVMLELSEDTVISDMDWTTLENVVLDPCVVDVRAVVVAWTILVDVTLVFSSDAVIFDVYLTTFAKEVFLLPLNQWRETSCCRLNYISGLHTGFIEWCRSIWYWFNRYGGRFGDYCINVGH